MFNLDRKYFLIIIALLITILFLAVIVFLFFNSNKKQSAVSPTIISNQSAPENKTSNLNKQSAPTRSQMKISKTDVVSKLVRWLNTMKNSADHQYYYALLCDQNNSCRNSPTDKQVSITALWSRYQYYKKTNKVEELGKIKEEISDSAKRSDISDYWLKVYQPDFWHCKLLYQMAQDNIFNEDYKNQLKKICQNNSFFLSYIELSNLANTNQQAKIFPQDLRRFAIYNSIISDFVSMYRWFKDERLLNIAKIYFINSKDYYLKNKVLASNSSYLIIASLDLYQATQDKTYLDFANSLYNQYDVNNSSLDLNQLTELCLTSQYYLDHIDKNQKYSIVKNNSLNTMINKCFNEGKGAFHNFGSNNLSFETRNNALLISCLIN